MKIRFFLLLFIISLSALPQGTLQPDVFPQLIVTDTFYGIPLEDPYRQLENLNDPNVIKIMPIMRRLY